MTSNIRVLVTGASGFIGSHVVQQLQQQGYQVRATVRSLKNEVKCKPLRQLCPEAKTPVELVEGDLSDESCWPKAVQGCNFVMHVASPFPSSKPKDENELIKPAVDGTLNVLKACASVGGVKRVVLTSSCAAVSAGMYMAGHFDENQWPDEKILDRDAYMKSKTLAERAAWDFVKNLKGDSKFELAVVNPVLVMGPVLIDTVTTSMEICQKLLLKQMPMLAKMNMQVVDVRDVAATHVRAMVVPEAAGHRHISHATSLWMEEVAKIFKEEFGPQGYNVPTTVCPNFVMSIMGVFDPMIKMIVPGLGNETSYDNSRMTRVLGVKPIDTKKTLVDMGYSMIERGMIKKTDKYRGPPQGTSF